MVTSVVEVRIITEWPLGSVKSNLLSDGAKVTACPMSRNKYNYNNGTSVMTLSALLFLEFDKTFNCRFKVMFDIVLKWVRNLKLTS
jgi:hypothetical protein